MSKNRTHAVDVAITCPACHQEGTFATWNCIDGTNDGALRQRVLTDEGLFFYTCPHCQANVHIEAPCLYINSREKWMVWHLPDLTEQITSAEVTAFLGQPSFAKYICRVSRTWGEWREKIIELESGYDDRLYEIIKYGAYSLLTKVDQGQLPLEAYHIDYTDTIETPQDVSLVFLRQDDHGKGYGYAINEKVKEVTQDIFLPILERLPNAPATGRFDRYDYSWAQQLVQYVIKAAATQENAKEYGQLIGFWVQTLGQEIFHKTITPPQ